MRTSRTSLICRRGHCVLGVAAPCVPRPGRGPSSSEAATRSRARSPRRAPIRRDTPSAGARDRSVDFEPCEPAPLLYGLPPAARPLLYVPWSAILPHVLIALVRLQRARTALLFCGT